MLKFHIPYKKLNTESSILLFYRIPPILTVNFNVKLDIGQISNLHLTRHPNLMNRGAPLIIVNNGISILDPTNPTTAHAAGEPQIWPIMPSGTVDLLILLKKLKEESLNYRSNMTWKRKSVRYLADRASGPILLRILIEPQTVMIKDVPLITVKTGIIQPQVLHPKHAKHAGPKLI
jgi:hypothetical protein